MDEMIEAEVSQAATDPAPEYLSPYQDPPGIDMLSHVLTNIKGEHNLSKL